MKKIYYYNRLYPEYGIKSFNVLDELYLVGKKVRVLQYLVANYDIERDIKDSRRWINIYSPFDDEEIFAYDKSHTRYGCDCILSFNKEKLTKRFKESFLYQKEHLSKRLQKFDEITME